MFLFQKRYFLPVIGVLLLSYCAFSFATRTSHDIFNLSAKDFFKNRGVIRLCHAIERDDLEEIKRLIKEDGVDVNTQGKDNVTPLLWAFFDEKIERFELLLENGADPNVAVTNHVGKGNVIQKGMSVTHLAAGSKFPNHFKLVMAHGGDPNLPDYWKDTPIITVIRGYGSNKRERMQLLIDAGAELDYMSLGTARTPLKTCVSTARRYDLAMMLLENKAAPGLYYSVGGSKLVDTVVDNEEYVRKFLGPKSKADYGRLIKWLEDHGEDFEVAHERARLWAGGIHFNGDSEDSRKYSAMIKTGKERFEKTKKMMKAKLKKWEQERLEKNNK